MEEASLRFNFSSSFPNEFTSLTASPFNWFEATYRYAEIKNQKYGPFGYSGNQSLKDKGFDVKVRLKEESFYLPAIADGFRDIAGSGDYGSDDRLSEFESKRTLRGNIDSVDSNNESTFNILIDRLI